jgi:hypothetical protein
MFPLMRILASACAKKVRQRNCLPLAILKDVITKCNDDGTRQLAEGTTA